MARFGPDDKCKCSHSRKDHNWRDYPGACAKCKSIYKCSVFKLPLTAVRTGSNNG